MISIKAIPNHNKVIGIWFLVLETLDVLSTRLGVAFGLVETNPMFSVLHLPLNVFLAIKIIVVALIAYRIFTKGIAKWMVWTIFSIMGAVIVSNLTQTVIMAINS